MGSNAEKEKRFALDQLHAVIGVKRKGVWSKIYESLMKRHLELCVDLKDHHTAKDGLHQYRNLCQTVDPNSLEVVIVYLMELSEARATAARQKADKVALAAAARVSDLDQEESPESIMLSSMTEEGAKDRTDREVVVPWLKFLWENYRAILELLYKIPKLEKVYHKTCEKAFKFCLDYTRVLEFRRLCDMLRQQLANLQKMPAVAVRAVRPQWEWTPEAIEYHLQTRFSQLEVATTLELWNEGFRTVEDIYAIIVAGKKAPAAKLMVSYYEKLTRIFWVSDNKLFHAYAWYRYYLLSVETRTGAKGLKAEERSLLASSVLLAALTIPSTKDIYASIAVDDDEVVVEKNSQMALLLDFQTNPSRQALLADIAAKGMLAEVLPELATLYQVLESKFQPTSLVKSITAAVTAIKAVPSLAAYASPLQKVIVIKVLQQLSRVYSTVRIEFVNNLLSGLSDLTANLIEKIVIEGVSSKQLNLKINHSNGSIVFGAAVAANAALDVQVSTLGAQLNRISNTISDTLGDVTLAIQRANARKEFLAKVLDAADEEYETCLERKSLIERRKEGLERLQHEKQKEEKRVKDIDEARRKKEEDERLVNEEAVRNLEKKKKLMEKIELQRVQKELEKYGVVMDEAEIAVLDNVSRRALILDAQAESLKGKEEENRRMTEQARKLDHITRALRIEGASAIVTKYAAQLEEDNRVHMEREKERQVELAAKHAADLAEKARLSRMQAHRAAFEDALLKKQRADYERKTALLKKAALIERRDQNIARARRLREEELDRQEEEEQRQQEILAKAEQARVEREQAEKLRRQREQEEAVERDREAHVLKMKKQIAEAEEAAKASAAAYKPPSARTVAPPQAAPVAAAGGAAGFDRFRRDAPAPAPERKEGGDSWRGSRGSAASEGQRAPPSAEKPAAGGRWQSERERSAAPEGGARPPPRDGPAPSDDKWRRPGAGSSNAPPPRTNTRGGGGW